jgi:intracellular sulfur oxidation DsrE/DsrF family protein
MEMTRGSFLRHALAAAGAVALTSTKARADQGAPAKPAAPPPPPPPAAVHFPVLKPSEYDEKKMWAELKTKKPHKAIYQSAEPKLIIPGLASLYIHMQNSFNAGEFSFGWGKGNVAVGAVLYGPSIILALNDAMWAKYPFGAAFGMKDASGKPETANVYYKAQTSMSFDGDPGAGGNVYQDWSAEACLKRGAVFMVCNNALNAFAGMMAMQMGVDPKATVAEWRANIVPGFMVVPAGVGALQAAMETGWKMLPLI